MEHIFEWNMNDVKTRTKVKQTKKGSEIIENRNWTYGVAQSECKKNVQTETHDQCFVSFDHKMVHFYHKKLKLFRDCFFFGLNARAQAKRWSLISDMETVLFI